MKNTKVLILVALAAVAAIVVWYFFIRKGTTTATAGDTSAITSGKDPRDVAAFNQMIDYFRSNDSVGDGDLQWMLPLVQQKLAGTRSTDASYKINGTLTITGALLSEYAQSVGKDAPQITATDRQAFHNHMYDIFYNLKNQLTIQGITS